jgi:hypothetical protein
MGNEANPILGVLLACVAGTLVLAAITIWLAKSKRVTSRKALLGLTILSMVPLFGAAFAMMTTHVVEEATGQTQSGVNGDPRR